MKIITLKSRLFFAIVVMCQSKVRKRISVFIAESDKHYSLARIARSALTMDFVAEGDEQKAQRLLLTFSERNLLQTDPAILAGRRSGDVGRFQRQKIT